MKRGVTVFGLMIACGGHTLAVPVPPSEDAATDASELKDASDTVDASDGWDGDSWCVETFPYGVAVCDDFDLSAMPKTAWTLVGSTAVDAIYFSAPHGLHVTATAGTASYLSYLPNLIAIESKFQAEVLVIADGTATLGSAPSILSLQCDGGQTLAVVLDPGTTTAHCVDSGFEDVGTYPPFDFARGTWHAIVLKMSVNDDGTYNPICEVDGANQGGLLGVATKKPLGNMTAIVGFTATTTQTMDAYYDNVADDVEQ